MSHNSNRVLQAKKRKKVAFITFEVYLPLGRGASEREKKAVLFHVITNSYRNTLEKRLKAVVRVYPDTLSLVGVIKLLLNTIVTNITKLSKQQH